MKPLSRRAFLLAVVALAPVTRRRAFAWQAPAFTAAEFLQISQRLTGRTTLDPDVAAIYYKALVAGGVAASLDRAALERTILEWWDTGVYTVRGEQRVATHSGALIWSAMGMPAPGTCAAPFGAWAQPPRPIA